MKSVICLLIVSLTLAFFVPVFACTTTLVGKKASADGSVLVSHSDDAMGDQRLVYVPAKDHEPGSMRQIYYSHCAMGFKPEWGGNQVFRLNAKDIAPAYDMTSTDVPLSVPLGAIPQVPHTYAYFTANYGIINEHQLAMGECTDKAKVHPQPEPGKRIFYSAALSNIALERCKTAREAIKLMGELIKEYGYYGTGETLLVADPNEGWVFEMCGYDLDGTDGVWVAKRVPDDAFFVAANQFRIRDIRKDDPDMMYSDNIFDVAKSKGWWKPEDGPLDFTKVYGDGEFHHPYYSLRRVWRAQSLAAPSLNLPAWVDGPDTRAYPFAVKPDNKLDVAGVMNIHRDNYEGTEFDLTKGLAAGPFGNPNRFEGPAESVVQNAPTPPKGAFERPLNIYRCAYCYVNQVRSWLPDAIGGISWYGSDRPATSVLLPYYTGVSDLPEQVQKGNALELDRESVWTAFNYVANYAMLKYDYMIKDINAQRETFETRFFGEQKDFENKAAELWKKGEQDAAVKLLTEYANANTKEVLDAWWKLSDSLYIKYNDGYINSKESIAVKAFYPSWWLKKVGYTNGPTSYKKLPEEN